MRTTAVPHRLPPELFAHLWEANEEGWRSEGLTRWVEFPTPDAAHAALSAACVAVARAAYLGAPV